MSSELELLRKRITELEAENTKLRQIIEENSKREAESAEHKVIIEELEKSSADISAENAELKAELAKLRHYFDFFNLTRLQQFQHVTNVQNFGEEDISSVTAVPQPDAEPKRHLASNDIPDPSMEERETDAFLGEVYKKSNSFSVMKDKKSQSHMKRKAKNIVQNVFDFTTTLALEKNHMTEIFMTENLLSVTENIDEKNFVVILSVVK
ncbi:10410_t:CDS:2, partial [Cetraspora pellucida]